MSKSRRKEDSGDKEETRRKSAERVKKGRRKNRINNTLKNIKSLGDVEDNDLDYLDDGE